MLKKLFEIKVAGFYILPMVAGVLYSLLQLTALAISARSGMVRKSAADAQLILADSVFDWAFSSYSGAIFIVAGFITVALYVIMIKNGRHWRTKFLQSIGWGFTSLYLGETALINLHLDPLIRMYGFALLLPPIVFACSTQILRKTREPEPMQSSKYEQTEAILGSPEDFVRRFINEEGLQYDPDGRKITEEELVMAAREVWQKGIIVKPSVSKAYYETQKIGSVQKLNELGQNIVEACKADQFQRVNDSLQRADKVEKL